MSRRKSLIPTLPLLAVSYHMVRLMTVITNNSSIAWPSRVTDWTTISVLLLFGLTNVRLTRALLIWA